MTKEITAFLALMSPMNSVDLFFREDEKGKLHWGIFEYCIEFGTHAFEVSDMVQYHKDFIIHLYKKKFK